MAPSVPPPLSPRELGALDLQAHLRDPALKQSFVTPLFEHVAPRYDAFTRLFSFGMDARWKDGMMRRFDREAPARGTVLDVACGTGDLALAAGRLRPECTVLGIDAATGMIERAKRRVDPRDAGRIGFRAGDLTCLPLTDASADVVLAGYALRNVPDYRTALRELARVLRPGGTLLTLDFYLPRAPVWRELFVAYLQLAGGAVGWWWHRSPVIYAYIAHSIRHFVTSEDFAESLADAGFVVRATERRLGGGIAVHHAVRR